MYNMYNTLNLALAVMFIAVYLAEGQFPRSCTTETALKRRECCPVYISADVQSKCGRLHGRGSCTQIESLALPNNKEILEELLLDDRKEWPRVFYDKACECLGNFDGVNCGKCKPGFMGEDCQVKKPLSIRKNIKSLSRRQLKEFVDKLDKAKRANSENYVILTTSYDRILAGEQPKFSNVSVYDLFSWMHYYVSRKNLVLDRANIPLPSSPSSSYSSTRFMKQVAEVLKSESTVMTLSDSQDYAHEGPAFLPWHRYFLVKWEEEIRDALSANDDFVLPYWDWRETESCDVCTNQMMGGRSPVNPSLISRGSVFSNWEVICTDGDEYLINGIQCDGRPEGPLLRNHGDYDVSQISGIPTRQDVANSLQFSNYETSPYDRTADECFRNVVEGFADPENGNSVENTSTMHNAVHIYMNGTMSEVASSANDPAFVIHHSFIDSLFEIWLQRREGENVFDGLNQDSDQLNTRVGHRLQDFMVPFFPLVRNVEGFKNTMELGYKYDYIEDDEQPQGSSTIDSESSLGETQEQTQTHLTEIDEQESMEIVEAIAEEIPDDDYFPEQIDVESFGSDLLIAEGNFGELGAEGSISRKSVMTKLYLAEKRNRKLRNANSLSKKSQESRLGEGVIQVGQVRKEKQKKLSHIGKSRGSLIKQLSLDRQMNQIEIGSEIVTPWDSFVVYLQDSWDYVAREWQGNIILFTVLPVLLLASATTLICHLYICRKKSKKGYGCCKTCCTEDPLYYEEDECKALLESCANGRVKSKTINGRSYIQNSECGIWEPLS